MPHYHSKSGTVKDQRLDVERAMGVLWQLDLEAAPGQERLPFDKDFKFGTFWERPPLWVRFKSIKRTETEVSRKETQEKAAIKPNLLRNGMYQHEILASALLGLIHLDCRSLGIEGRIDGEQDLLG